MTSILHTPDTKLPRTATALALTQAGYPIKATTLATYATRPGKAGGPPYTLFCGRALYRWGDALEWAQSVSSAPRRNTSEADQRAA